MGSLSTTRDIRNVSASVLNQILSSARLSKVLQQIKVRKGKVAHEPLEAHKAGAQLQFLYQRETRGMYCNSPPPWITEILVYPGTAHRRLTFSSLSLGTN